MGFDFRIRDFAYPRALLQLHHEFERNQWSPPESLAGYQLERLRSIATHASERIPFYRRLFRAYGFDPARLKPPSDIGSLPLLSRDAVRGSCAELCADNAARLHPRRISTSGSSGIPLQLLVDRSANVLEFAYYWRAWGWAGFRPGRRFAELSSEYFAVHHKQLSARRHHYQHLTRRLLLNSLMLSRDSAAEYLRLLRRFRPGFLKGLPSNLYVLALLASEYKDRPRFEAVFSQGENLYPQQRRLIEEVFAAPVFDSYGHLERTAAISQCPSGRYHLHQDYGLIELLPVPHIASVQPEAGGRLVEIVGSSLHNYAMPLLRYRTGDLAEVEEPAHACPCGRTLPTVKRIIGRESDVIITPDRRAVTALYLAFELVPGLLLAQVEQPRLDTLIVRFACEAENERLVGAALKQAVSSFVGSGVQMHLERRDLEELRGDRNRKFKAVCSHVPIDALRG